LKYLVRGGGEGRGGGGIAYLGKSRRVIDYLGRGGGGRVPG